MPLGIICGGCKRKLRIPETLVGKPVKCPGCGLKVNTKPKAKESGSAEPSSIRFLRNSTTR